MLNIDVVVCRFVFIIKSNSINKLFSFCSERKYFAVLADEFGASKTAFLNCLVDRPKFVYLFLWQSGCVLTATANDRPHSFGQSVAIVR